jgi:hypothetical protein
MKNEISKNWYWGFVDIRALSNLKAGIGYVVKYLTKVHRVLIDKVKNEKYRLTLALMWIFKKRAFSISKGFKENILIVDSKIGVVGQVDLEGKTIFKWYLVGFYAHSFNVWVKNLSYREFFEIYSSNLFTPNRYL